jgi:methylated-DNA-protein-cysteine methyltransferase-like protein
MPKSNLFEQVYKVVRKIPEGKVSTYGQIAHILGTRDVRKIGYALHANPDSSNVPCHRVVNKEGRLAPGYAFGGPNEQKMRLMSEGVIFIDDDHVDLQKCQILS